MDLDGARNAKAEIFKHVFGGDGNPEEGANKRIVERAARHVMDRAVEHGSAIDDGEWQPPGRSVLPRAIAAAARLSRRRSRSETQSSDAPARSPRAAMPAIAIGIQRSRDHPNTRLVLIAPDAGLRTHPMVERAISMAKGEARFVAGGEPRPLSFWQPPRLRPLMLGTSISNHRSSAGTLGAFVELADGTIGILSNNHVLADVNRAIAGDPVIQPGRTDGGRADSGDAVGTLLKFVPLVSGVGVRNAVDCAVASLGADLAPTNRIATQDGQPALKVNGLATEPLFLNDPVWKAGRTTGLTNGRVFAVEVDNFAVNLGTSINPFRCRFDGQIQAYAEDRALAKPGDSGALLMDQDGMAHGLLFAGSQSDGPAGTGLVTFNPLELVLEKLDATLWTR